MKTLSLKLDKKWSSEYILYNGVRYRLRVENDNSYFYANIYRQTQNGDFSLIADKADIEGIKDIKHIWSDNERIECAKQNLELMKKWLKKVF